MDSNKKIIFISVFIFVGILLLGFYVFINKNSTDEEGKKVSFYQKFNPFKLGDDTPTDEEGEGGKKNEEGEGNKNEEESRFYKITDFAVSGATFLEDKRLIDITNTDIEPQEPEEVTVTIDANTQNGRKEIQTILNEKLNLKPQLVVDGNFGAKAVTAIKEFQKTNDLTITGKIDEETAPFFTKTVKNTNIVEQDPYEKAPSIRYVERKNGHVYKMFLDTKIKEKISNLTLTSIHEAYFNDNGDSVIYRYLAQDDSISTLSMKIDSSVKDFLPQNITDIAASLDQTRLFYLVKNKNGSTGLTRNFEDKKENIVFNSPFTEWLPQWTNNQNIFLTTKPYYGTNGSIFILNTASKTITKVFGGVAGLTTLVNANSSNILYSVSTGTGPKLNVFNISKHESVDLKTSGLPEKCVWGSDDTTIYCAVPNVITGNQYPNIWYQGLISFDDYFVKINTITGDKTTIANSIDETPVDATNLFLNRDENKLFFINKKDYTLWSLDL